MWPDGGARILAGYGRGRWDWVARHRVAGHLGDGVRGQALVGAVFAGLAAFMSVRFLLRFFETRTLLPFAIYSLAIGIISIIRFA